MLNMENWSTKNRHWTIPFYTLIEITLQKECQYWLTKWPFTKTKKVTTTKQQSTHKTLSGVKSKPGILGTTVYCVYLWGHREYNRFPLTVYHGEIRYATVPISYLILINVELNNI